MADTESKYSAVPGSVGHLPGLREKPRRDPYLQRRHRLAGKQLRINTPRTTGIAHHAVATHSPIAVSHMSSTPTLGISPNCMIHPPPREPYQPTESRFLRGSLRRGVPAISPRYRNTSVPATCPCPGTAAPTASHRSRRGLGQLMTDHT